MNNKLSDNKEDVISHKLNNKIILNIKLLKYFNFFLLNCLYKKYKDKRTAVKSEKKGPETNENGKNKTSIYINFSILKIFKYLCGFINIFLNFLN